MDNLFRETRPSTPANETESNGIRRLVKWKSIENAYHVLCVGESGICVARVGHYVGLDIMDDGLDG